MRRWSGLDRSSSQSTRFAYRRHYRREPWTDFTEIHWEDQTQAYVTPVSPEEVCVVLTSNKPNPRFGETLGRFPRLVKRFEGAPNVSSERGAVTGMLRLKRVYRGNVALIGDASGGVDAITGEGLCLSFRQATALAAALVEGDLERYQESHRRLLRRPWLMGNLLLLLDRRTGLRDRTMRALEAAPKLFKRMLAYHLGETRPLHLVTTGALLGWRFLAA